MALNIFNCNWSVAIWYNDKLSHSKFIDSKNLLYPTIYKVYLMSADRQLLTQRASNTLHLSANLSNAAQRAMDTLLGLLTAKYDGSIDEDSDIDQAGKQIDIKRFVDGRGLACPMPLMKTKVALRDVDVDESVYVVATDPNSQADIMAFCRQSQQTQATDYLVLYVNDVTAMPADSTSLQRFATIYHFIITKTDSN